MLERPTNASAMAVQLPGPPCFSIWSRSNASSCGCVIGWSVWVWYWERIQPAIAIASGASAPRPSAAEAGKADYPSGLTVDGNRRAVGSVAADPSASVIPETYLRRPRVLHHPLRIFLFRGHRTNRAPSTMARTARAELIVELFPVVGKLARRLFRHPKKRVSRASSAPVVRAKAGGCTRYSMRKQ